MAHLNGGPPNHITKDFLTPFLTGATLCLKNDAKNIACPCFKGSGLPALISENKRSPPVNSDGSDNKPLPLKQGQAIFFASFLRHKVAPVKKGVRKSLVMWFGGPPFK